MFIRSERLFLRPGWAEDRHELLALIGEENGQATMTHGPACAPWVRAVASAIAGGQESPLPRFLVTLPDTRPGALGARLIGVAALDRAGQDIGIGVWIGGDHRDRGYADEAARALTGLARALGHHPVVPTPQADCDTDPGPTRRAA